MPALRNLWLCDAPESLMSGIHKFAFEATRAAVKLEDGPHAEPAATVIAQNVVSMVSRATIKGDADILPKWFDDVMRIPRLVDLQLPPAKDFSLQGALSRFISYPIQLGLITARAGLEIVASTAKTHPAQKTEQEVIRRCAASVIHHLAWHCGLLQELNLLNTRVNIWVDEALSKSNPSSHIDKIVDSIKSARKSGKLSELLLKGESVRRGAESPLDLCAVCVAKTLLITQAAMQEIRPTGHRHRKAITFSRPKYCRGSHRRYIAGAAPN